MYNLETKYTIFDSIKHIDENGVEFWYARELQKILEYKRWDKFNNVINNSIMSCNNSNNNANDHFSQVGKMIKIAKGGKRKVTDYKLSRYACYLIAQNGDSRKKVIALAQTYFAIQTRKMELTEIEYENMSDSNKSLKELEKEKKSIATSL